MLFPHEGFHIHPGGVHPFCQGIVPLIEDGIYDLQAQVAHGHFIDVRERQGHFHIHAVMVLYDAVPFAADITGGLLDMHQPHGINFYRVHGYSYRSLEKNKNKFTAAVIVRKRMQQR